MFSHVSEDALANPSAVQFHETYADFYGDLTAISVAYVEVTCNSSSSSNFVLKKLLVTLRVLFWMNFQVVETDNFYGSHSKQLFSPFVYLKDNSGFCICKKYSVVSDLCQLSIFLLTLLERLAILYTSQGGAHCT